VRLPDPLGVVVLGAVEDGLLGPPIQPRRNINTTKPVKNNSLFIQFTKVI
jgi:hypothetical protein